MELINDDCEPSYACIFEPVESWAVVGVVFSSSGLRVTASYKQSNYIAYNLIIITIHCSHFQLMTWN